MRGWLSCLCVLLGCANVGPTLPGFEDPGRLLIVLERAGQPELHVIDRSGARRVPGVRPREARWIDPRSILIVSEIPAAEEFGLPRTRLLVFDVDGHPRRMLAEPGRHYDAEPSPDGRWLAFGAEAQGTGDSDLEIWSLGHPSERVAVRHQSLEEPRWRHDGMALVVSVLRADPESDDDRGGEMLGTSLHWPRLHVLRRDLGHPTLLWDGEDARSLAPGGSLPLWWDEDGIFARQRQGLVRCQPVTGGCTPVYRSEAERRVVDGRRIGNHLAWLLTVEARDAFDRSPPDELLCVDLRDGRVRSRWRAPEGVAITEIDWIGAPAP